MGTTLHGLIELKELDSWTDIATVEFNKNRILIDLLWEHAPRDWPKDRSAQADILQEEGGADTGLSWCDLALLKTLAEKEASSHGQPAATVAFMSVIEGHRSGSTRILFYEM